MAKSASPQKKQTEVLDRLPMALNSISQTLVAIGDLSKTLDEIARSAHQVLGADLVELYQYVQAHHEFILPPTRVGERRHPFVPKVKIYEDDVVVRAVKLGRPQYIRDAQGTDMLTGKFEVPRADAPDNRFVIREGIVSSAIVPLKVAGETVGVMFVNYRTPRTFDKDQKERMSSFANLAAIAIYNARLFERRRQADMLQDVARIVNSALLFPDVIERVLDQLGRVIEYDSASVQLIKGDRRTLAGGRGSSMGELPEILLRDVSKDRLIQRIVHQRRPLVLSDVNDERLWKPMPQTSHVKSWIGAPLIAKGQVIGLLTLDHRKAGCYTQQSGDLVAAFGDQVAIAIHNSAQARALAELNDLTRQLVSVEEAPHDTRVLLEQIANSALDILNADLVDLYEYVQERDDFNLPQIGAGKKRGPKVLKKKVEKDDVVAKLIRKKTPSYYKNVQTSKTFSGPYTVERKGKPDKRFIFRERIHSVAVIPLRVGGETVGLMFVSYRTPQKFLPEQQELAELFANQAAIAVRNARQLEAKQRLDAQLENLSQVVKGQSLEDVLDRTVEGICAILGEGASTSINLYDKIMGSFGQSYACGPLQKKLRIPPRATGTGMHVVKTKAPLYMDDVFNPPLGCPPVRGEAVRIGVKSFAAIPIKLKDDVVGVLFVNMQKYLAFSDEIKRILGLFAGRAAIAIENARLYEHISQDLERRIRELEILNTIGRIVSTLSIDEILEQIHTQAGKLMDVRNLYIAFYDEDTDTVTFPLAYVGGKKVEPGVGAWSPRHRADPLGEGEEREADEPRYGLTEYAIDQKKAEVSTGNMRAWARERRIELSPDIPTQSWIGAPLKVWDRAKQKEKIIGVISIQSHEKQDAYDAGDLRVLETMANQSAVAIENARLYVEQRDTILTLEEAQDRIRQLERVRTISNMAADFVHRINNMAGTIPIRVKRIREVVNSQYPQAKRKLAPFLKGIMEDTQELLDASGQLQKLTQSPPEPQPINVQAVIGTVVREALLQTPSSIQVHVEHARVDLPLVLGIEAEFEDAIRDITTNAIEAMAEKGGRLEILTTCNVDNVGRPWVEIEVKDTGAGIPPDALSNVFNLFYTTKESGLGYGLWRVKNTVEALNGKITLDSQVGQGTVVHIWLPALRGGRG
ncbi:MAG: GAF domain-containing protein [Thermoflexales bacterium]|nr:GAF domain-containing protein [Thermoflexales bacterium]